MARSSGALPQGTMNVVTLIICAVVTLAFVPRGASATLESGCTVSINYGKGDLKEPQPLLLDNGSGSTSFLYPIDKWGTVKLKGGQRVVIACPGRGNYIQGIHEPENLNEIEATCLRGKTFTSISSSQFDFSNLACKKLPTNVARRTKTSCYKDEASIVEVGFMLKKEFLKTFEVCRNDRTMMTLWTRFTLTPRIAAYQAGFPRPQKWQTGDFFADYDVEKQYQVWMQKRTLAQLLGSQHLADKYIDPSMKRFMARGHLTAKADFVYGSAQSSTFWYVNAAPQWQTFNGGNWNTLESSVRKFASGRSSDLEVYTGTFGQMSLSNNNGNQVPIFLHANGTSKTFPVPKFFWKIIHDRKTRSATAFVGCNDPWANNVSNDMFICHNVIENIPWLKWNSMDIVKGISYACTVNDLRKTVSYIPDFPVNGILV